MATNYEINYNDERFTKVEEAKSDALSDLEKTYTDMIAKSDDYYNAQINASKEWADKQAQYQKEKGELEEKKLQQQKEQAEKDYIKEQSAAYVDWKKQSDPYGVNAEKMATQGLQNSGYSESVQASYYNTYQNRLATAREAFVLANQNYDIAIAEAQRQNNATLAEMAYQAYQQQLELSLQGFQYKNTLLLEKADKKTSLENTYYSRYQDVLNQINTENSLAEQIRQYNETLAEEKRQFNETMAYNKSKSSGGGGGSGSGGGLQVESDTGSKLKSYDPTQNSIAKLGYGPISANKLADLVGMGEVIITYDKDGNEIFKRADNKTAALTKDGESDLMAAQKKLDKYTMLRL